jgi:hypothetical protein
MWVWGKIREKPGGRAMSSEAKYQIVLKASDGTHISDWYDADNLKRAKEIAKRLLSDDWARDGETTHETLGTEKVEVLNNKTGECMYDEFYKAKQELEPRLRDVDDAEFAAANENRQDEKKQLLALAEGHRKAIRRLKK